MSVSVIAEDKTDKPVHLFVLSGQSNMARMNPKTGFIPEAENLFKDEKIVYIKKSMGSQYIHRWLPEWDEIAKSKGLEENHRKKILRDGKVLYYQPILDQYKELLKKYPKPASVTFCWMQGESDAQGRVSVAYKDSLKLLISNFRRDLKRPDMNVVIGRIADYALDKKECVKIRRVQIEIANEDPHGAWVDTDDLNNIEVNGVLKNDIHYSKKGYVVLGQRFARQAHALITGKEPAKDGRP
ncbi:acetyl xylan esterase A [Lentisphaera araneosa HTCC2155]|uniref:Acetyl xylan esterase A n=2 Tax=Lentisphaera TaxID=256846 RepID=A6DIF1_9BACT|nr:acetyl xylan esterase A [Lentisphaera araneosa HTCC2155]